MQGRQFVRKLLYRAPPQLPLPEFRAKEEPTFTYVGADFGRSLQVKSLNRPLQKVGSAFTHAASLEPSIWN